MIHTTVRYLNSMVQKKNYLNITEYTFRTWPLMLINWLAKFKWVRIVSLPYINWKSLCNFCYYFFLSKIISTLHMYGTILKELEYCYIIVIFHIALNWFFLVLSWFTIEKIELSLDLIFQKIPTNSHWRLNVLKNGVELWHLKNVGHFEMLGSIL